MEAMPRSSVWRVTENALGHTIYAGIYTRNEHRRYEAKLLKSTDEGETWQTVFEDSRLDHIHSVRWDPKYNRLYMSAGDGARRGQAYSDDGERLGIGSVRGENKDIPTSRSANVMSSGARTTISGEYFAPREVRSKTVRQSYGHPIIMFGGSLPKAAKFTPAP